MKLLKSIAKKKEKNNFHFDVRISSFLITICRVKFSWLATEIDFRNHQLDFFSVRFYQDSDFFFQRTIKEIEECIHHNKRRKTSQVWFNIPERLCIINDLSWLKVHLFVRVCFLFFVFQESSSPLLCFICEDTLFLPS